MLPAACADLLGPLELDGSLSQGTDSQFFEGKVMQLGDQLLTYERGADCVEVRLSAVNYAATANL